MRTRQLGPSGLVVSVVGLGCNNFGGRIGLEETRAVVDAAIDEGITLFDTADIYGNRGGSETALGEVLAGRRDRIVLATKFGMEMGDGTEARGSREYVRKALDASLERLRTDRIDLYQYHRPDGITPIEETVGAMEELVAEGKVLALGSSNFDAAQVEAAGTRLVTAQNEYSLLEREAEAELVPVLERLGIGLLPYFPLASGLLTGKHRRDRIAEGTRMTERAHDVTVETWDRLEELERLARSMGRTILELAIGGLAAMPAVASVIAGATKPEQVRANAAAGAWEPTADELVALR
jgi:aryl-alcohol dehydrogenase-like predicted oxidoreductase